VTPHSVLQIVICLQNGQLKDKSSEILKRVNRRKYLLPVVVSK